MKKVVFILAILVTFNTSIFAQNEVDALRYSQNYYGGTTRFMTMGGAFGALGGDISSVSINPAGIGLYRRSEFTVTPNFNYNSVESVYKNSKSVYGKYDLNLNNIGFVGSSINESETDGWVGTSFAFGYNRLQNFDQHIVIEGTNTTSSLLDAIVNNINSGSWGNFENLAADAELVYYIVGNDTLDAYISDYDGTNYGQNQRKSLYKEGGIGEYHISFAANYSHKLYIGGSLGIQRINYEEHSELSENDPNDLIPYLGSFSFDDHLNVTGKGFNLKFGMIYKPVNAVRIGASVHTPTFLDMNEEYYSELESSIDFGSGLVTDSYKTSTGHFEYELTTPFKLNTSVAFVLNKMAILSVDYEFVDYTKAHLWESSYTFSSENSNIRNRYTATNNLRTGAEVRFGPMSVRGGFAIYGSPYTSGEPNKNASYQILSGGIGTRGDGYFIDFGYIYTMSDEKYFLYGAEEAKLNSSTSQIIATLGFRF